MRDVLQLARPVIIVLPLLSAGWLLLCVRHVLQLVGRRCILTVQFLSLAYNYLIITPNMNRAYSNIHYTHAKDSVGNGNSRNTEYIVSKTKVDHDIKERSVSATNHNHNVDRYSVYTVQYEACCLQNKERWLRDGDISGAGPFFPRSGCVGGGGRRSIRTMDSVCSSHCAEC